MEFALIVEEVDTKSPSGWQTLATFDVESVRPSFHANAGRLATAAEERFKKGSFIADLTPWAGRYVRLVFEVRFKPGTPGLMRARWLQGRLVSSSFKVTLSEPERTSKRYSDSLKSAAAAIDAVTQGPADDIDLLVVSSFPDTGLTDENFQGRQVAYCGAAFTDVTPWLGGGNLVIDLSYSGEDVYGATITNLRDGLIRKVNDAPSFLPGLVNHYTPGWRVLLPRIAENLDNHYSGIGGVIADTSTSVDYLHAVFHCEDKTDLGEIYSTTHDVMCRIAYARSQIDGSSNDAYHISRVANASTTTETPDGYAIITPPFTESDYRTARGNNEEEAELWGDGTPHILKSGSYYY